MGEASQQKYTFNSSFEVSSSFHRVMAPASLHSSNSTLHSTSSGPVLPDNPTQQTARELAIFWDYENVSLPKWCDPAEASSAIVQRLGHLGRIVDRRLYFDFESSEGSSMKRLWSSLDSSGFALVNTPRRGVAGDVIKKETLDKKLIADVLTFAWDSAVRSKDAVKPCVVLLTSDGDYAYTLNRLRDRGVTTVVIYNEGRVAPVLTSSADLPLRLEQDILKYLKGNPESVLSPSGALQSLSSVLAVPPSSLILPASPTESRAVIASVESPELEVPQARVPSIPALVFDAEGKGIEAGNLAELLCQVLCKLDGDEDGWISARSAGRKFWDSFATRGELSVSNRATVFKNARSLAVKWGWIEMGTGDRGEVTKSITPEIAATNHWLRLTGVEELNESASCASTQSPTESLDRSITGGSDWVFIGNIGHMKHVQELVTILNGVDSRVDVLCAYQVMSRGAPCGFGYARLSSTEQVRIFMTTVQETGVSLDGVGLRVEDTRAGGKNSLQRWDPTWCFVKDLVDEEIVDDFRLLGSMIRTDAKALEEWNSSNSVLQQFRNHPGVGKHAQSTIRFRKAFRYGAHFNFLEFSRLPGESSPCPFTEEIFRLRTFYCRLTKNSLKVINTDTYTSLLSRQESFSFAEESDPENLTEVEGSVDMLQKKVDASQAKARLAYRRSESKTWI